MTDPPHLVDLPGGRWRLWRTCGLRAPGFPAADVRRLANPELTARVDEALGLDTGQKGSSGLEEAFDSEIERLRAEIVAFATDPRFREAVTWQNRTFLQTGIAPLLRKPHLVNNDARKKWRAVASYVTRYSVKNDTIGFFGPWGWAEIDERRQGLDVRPGDDLVSSCAVSFETWAIDALAESFIARGSPRTFIRPRLMPYLVLDGDTLHVPFRGTLPVPHAQAEALRLCDGTRSLAEIAGAVVARPELGIATEEEVEQQLRIAAQMGVVTLSTKLAVAPEPEERLREELERWEDATARSASLRDLDGLVELKRKIAASVGDPEALDTALAALDDRFVALTGQGPTRRAGKMYAGRTLVYLDCRRDAEVTIGGDVLQRIGPALSLVLDSARWFSHAVAQEYLEIVERRYDEVVGSEPRPIPLAELFHWFERTYINGATLAIDGPERDLQARWAEVIQAGDVALAVRSADIAEAAAKAFDAPAAGWPLAYFAPDLTIAATSARQISEGKFLAVVGEVHYRNTLRSGNVVGQHPEPEKLYAMVAADYPGAHLTSRGRAESHRKMPLLLSRDHFQLHVTPEPILCDPARVLPVGELLVLREGGELVARTRDGRLEFNARAVLGIWLEEACSHAHVSLFPPRAHSPRISIDDVVVAREKWRFAASELSFASLAFGLRMFAEARAFVRRHGLPDRVFASIRTETKPVYVDFESPILVDCLARIVRSAVQSAAEIEVVMTEMLPGLETCWLTDASGNRHTSELRFIALERLGGA